MVIFQRTSANKIREGTKLLYDAGINIEVRKVDNAFENNYVVCTKNRNWVTGLGLMWMGVKWDKTQNSILVPLLKWYYYG